MSVATTIAKWAAAVRQDPAIRAEFKQAGKLHVHELAVSDCQFDNSASGISDTEYLHLRTVWYHYKNQIDNFAKLLRDDKETGYKGFISPEAYELAGKLMARPSSYLQEYLKECQTPPEDSNSLHPSPDGGHYAMVRYWQVMTTTHTKDGGTGSSKIFKPQVGSSAVAAQASATGRATTPPGQQASTTPPRQTSLISNSPPKFETPAAKSHPAARGTAENRPSADEAYVNTAMLLLLQAVTQDFHQSHEPFKSLHWVPPRMALRLKAPVLNKGTKKYEEKFLLEARVDGYLCSNQHENELRRPMAICEAKSGVRRSIQVSTERQEAAEMAAWIYSHPGSDGLLQSSASGKKRRLMISQNRDEIYIIIGEYGVNYERYIRSRPFEMGMTKSMADKAPKIHTTLAGNLGDTLGSPTFLSRLSASGIEKDIEGWEDPERKAVAAARALHVRNPSEASHTSQATSGELGHLQSSSLPSAESRNLPTGAAQTGAETTGLTSRLSIRSAPKPHPAATTSHKTDSTAPGGASAAAAVLQKRQASTSNHAADSVRVTKAAAVASSQAAVSTASVAASAAQKTSQKRQASTDHIADNVRVTRAATVASKSSQGTVSTASAAAAALQKKAKASNQGQDSSPGHTAGTGRATRAAAAAAQSTAGSNAGTDHGPDSGASATGAPAAPPAQALDLPSAGEFLIMHRFGPWPTSDRRNMEVLIRRLLALMLQLDGHMGQTASKPATQTVTKTATQTATQAVPHARLGSRPGSRGSAK